MTTPAVVSFYLAVLCAAIVWAGFSEPGLVMLWRLPVEASVPGWAAGIATGLALVVASIIAEPFVPSLRRLSREIRQAVAPITTTRVAVLALTSGIAEEALFRGPVQHSFGYVVASVLFALLHGGLSKRYIAWSTFALLAGLSFGLLVEVYQSIVPAALAHVVVNGINLARLARADDDDELDADLHDDDASTPFDDGF